MSDFLSIKNEFLEKAVALIEENLGDEQFGVSELADAIGMSRSNLLRKVRKLTDLSVSQFIRQVRLHHAKEMLQDESLAISEIAFRVGFSSTSYFTKCFREQYGYPPGEEARQQEPIQQEFEQEQEKEEKGEQEGTKGKVQPVQWLIALGAAALILAVLYVFPPGKAEEPILEKSIAVLPFKNDSPDSTNQYIINGLMEAVLNNLQQIEDLRVISRTSVESYRNRPATIAQMSEELEVNYFVEGSGQKVGDRILLTIQLIEAPRDNHLWSTQYDRTTRDIFQLQAEVAGDIASQIQAVITPEEQLRITKIPTENLVAYDHFLKGMDYANQQTAEGLEEAVKYFQLAIEEDPNFANAHAYMAICYYYMDVFLIDKTHLPEILSYADKAILLDPELPESLIAKGMYFMTVKRYESAVEYLEKALEFNPNSGWAHNFLLEIYSLYLPDIQNYLTHALESIKRDIATEDSTVTSLTYLHLGNALAQNGFIDEAEEYIARSLNYNPNNIFSMYVGTYIQLAQDRDFAKARESLTETLARDTTRLDVMQELAKVCYSMRDYESAAYYYDKFLAIQEMLQLSIFRSEDLKIGFVMKQQDREEEAAFFYERFRQHAENDNSIYKHLSLAAYYGLIGDIETGIENLKLFTREHNYQYWFVLLLKDDPIMEHLASHPDYAATMQIISDNFWEDHRKLREVLEDEGLL